MARFLIVGGMFALVLAGVLFMQEGRFAGTAHASVSQPTPSELKAKWNSLKKIWEKGMREKSSLEDQKYEAEKKGDHGKVLEIEKKIEAVNKRLEPYFAESFSLARQIERLKESGKYKLPANYFEDYEGAEPGGTMKPHDPQLSNKAQAELKRLDNQMKPLREEWQEKSRKVFSLGDQIEEAQRQGDSEKAKRLGLQLKAIENRLQTIQNRVYPIHNRMQRIQETGLVPRDEGKDSPASKTRPPANEAVEEMSFSPEEFWQQSEKTVKNGIKRLKADLEDGKSRLERLERELENATPKKMGEKKYQNLKAEVEKYRGYVGKLTMWLASLTHGAILSPQSLAGFPVHGSGDSPNVYFPVDNRLIPFKCGGVTCQPVNLPADCFAGSKCKAEVDKVNPKTDPGFFKFGDQLVGMNCTTLNCQPVKLSGGCAMGTGECNMQVPKDFFANFSGEDRNVKVDLNPAGRIPLLTNQLERVQVHSIKIVNEFISSRIQLYRAKDRGDSGQVDRIENNLARLSDNLHKIVLERVSLTFAIDQNKHPEKYRLDLGNFKFPSITTTVSDAPLIDSGTDAQAFNVEQFGKDYETSAKKDLESARRSLEFNQEKIVKLERQLENTSPQKIGNGKYQELKNELKWTRERVGHFKMLISSISYGLRQSKETYSDLLGPKETSNVYFQAGDRLVPFNCSTGKCVPVKIPSGCFFGSSCRQAIDKVDPKTDPFFLKSGDKLVGLNCQTLDCKPVKLPAGCVLGSGECNAQIPKRFFANFSGEDLVAQTGTSREKQLLEDINKLKQRMGEIEKKYGGDTTEALLKSIQYREDSSNLNSLLMELKVERWQDKPLATHDFSGSFSDSVSGEVGSPVILDTERALEEVDKKIKDYEREKKAGQVTSIPEYQYKQLLEERRALSNDIILKQDINRRAKEKEQTPFQSDLDYFGVCLGDEMGCNSDFNYDLFQDAKTSARKENREIMTESLSEFEALQRNAASSSSSTSSSSSSSSGGGRIVLVVDGLTTVQVPLHTETISFDGTAFGSGGDGLFTVFSVTIDTSCPSGATKTFQAKCNPASGTGAACRYQFKSLSGASCSLAVGAGPIILSGGQTSSQTCTCN